MLLIIFISSKIETKFSYIECSFETYIEWDVSNIEWKSDSDAYIHSIGIETGDARKSLKWIETHFLPLIEIKLPNHWFVKWLIIEVTARKLIQSEKDEISGWHAKVRKPREFNSQATLNVRKSGEKKQQVIYLNLHK